MKVLILTLQKKENSEVNTNCLMHKFNEPEKDPEPGWEILKVLVRKTKPHKLFKNRSSWPNRS